MSNAIGMNIVAQQARFLFFSNSTPVKMSDSTCIAKEFPPRLSAINYLKIPDNMRFHHILCNIQIRLESVLDLTVHFDH